MLIYVSKLRRNNFFQFLQAQADYKDVNAKEFETIAELNEAKEYY